MPGDYRQLLEATINYLEDLKSEGVQFLPVQPLTLAGLEAPADRHPPRATPSIPRDVPPIEAIRPTKPAQEERVFNSPAEEFAIDSAALEGTHKAQAFSELRTRALACVKCPHLAASRRNVVF